MFLTVVRDSEESVEATSVPVCAPKYELKKRADIAADPSPATAGPNTTWVYGTLWIISI